MIKRATRDRGGFGDEFDSEDPPPAIRAEIERRKAKLRLQQSHEAIHRREAIKRAVRNLLASGLKKKTTIWREVRKTPGCSDVSLDEIQELLERSPNAE
jgi:hypothetical protein